MRKRCSSTVKVFVLGSTRLRNHLNLTITTLVAMVGVGLQLTTALGLWVVEPLVKLEQPEGELVRPIVEAINHLQDQIQS